MIGLRKGFCFEKHARSIDTRIGHMPGTNAFAPLQAHGNNLTRTEIIAERTLVNALTFRIVMIWCVGVSTEVDCRADRRNQKVLVAGFEIQGQLSRKRYVLRKDSRL